jgi:hypothetical protein
MAATELAATGRLECVVKPLFGTNRTSSNVRSSVAIGGKPDMARTSSNRRE